VEITPCDVLDKQQVKAAMHGVNSVVHCVLGDAQTNVEGTGNLLDCALEAGISRFIHISTCEVYGHSVRGLVRETAQTRFTRWDYANSKIEAEKLCWEYHAKGLPVCILRPSIVYGPFSKQWVADLAPRLLSGRWGTFKKYGEGICNLIYIDDLVSAILLAEEKNEAIGEVFNINGPDTVTWNEYYRRYNAKLGLKELREISPSRALFMATAADLARYMNHYLKKHVNNISAYPVSRIGGAGNSKFKDLMRQLKYRLKIAPSKRHLLRLANRHTIYDGAKAKNLLGFTPKFDLDRALELSISWLAHHGYIPRETINQSV
jgi:nucleoside-diphosphate-sugar epimerase